MSKRIWISLLCVVSVVGSLSAQIVNAVHWSGTQVGDSVQLTATIDAGWHITLISVNDSAIGMEYSDTCILTVPYSGQDIAVRYNTCNDHMCTAPEVWHYAQDTPVITTTTPATANTNLWWIFLMGLLGGLLAIFTPCVWPIIPMTVSFFLKRSEEHGVRDALLYGLAIIVTYVGLGLLVTVIFGASALNALATNAIVNLFFFVLLVVFALSFFGLFEIQLPSSWSTKLDAKARNTGGMLSILMMALTLVIVSFSCTGPIIGTLLVEAAGHSLLAPAIGMLGFAIALALPFSLFAMFPKWMKQMPKSGGWMQSLKVVLAFIELALSLKFFSVADLAYGWGILSRWLFIAVWVVCFLGIGVYLVWGITRVSTTRKVIRSIVIIASWLFTVYLVPGLWGAPVKAISAFAPPMPVEGREVFNDYDEGLQYALQTGKPVLLDFSGYGCVNCRKMEAYVLDDDSVKARLNNYVVITLFVDDKQPREVKPAASTFGFAANDAQPADIKKESIGDYNSRIQREQYGSNAQPFFIQLSPQGTPISEPYAFSTSVEDFLRWLKY